MLNKIRSQGHSLYKQYKKEYKILNMISNDPISLDTKECNKHIKQAINSAFWKEIEITIHR